jgi:hypothetical protein
MLFDLRVQGNYRKLLTSIVPVYGSTVPATPKVIGFTHTASVHSKRKKMLHQSKDWRAHGASSKCMNRKKDMNPILIQAEKALHEAEGF